MGHRISLTDQELLAMLKDAYMEGYKAYEPQEAGLEAIDPEGMARYILYKKTKDNESNNV